MHGAPSVARVTLRALAAVLLALGCHPVLAHPDPPGGKPPPQVPPRQPSGHSAAPKWIRCGPPGAERATDSANVVRARVDGIPIEGDLLRRFLENGPSSKGPGALLLLDEPDAVALWIRVDRPREGEALRAIPVLSADDPSLDPLRIDVVDAVSGKPLPGATLHLFPMSDAPRVLEADAAGRIEIPDADSPHVPGQRLLARLSGSGSCVRAPGHASRSWGGWFPFADPAPAARTVEASDLVALQSRGALEARLRPLEQGAVERRARLLDAAGAPVAGAGIDITGPVLADALGALMPRSYGLQATDATGGFDVPKAPIVVVDVRLRGFPVAVFAIDTQGEGPLDLRLPPVAEATIVLTGGPAGGAHWSFDRLANARTPADGPVVPATFGPGIEALLLQRGLRLWCGQFDAAGLLPSGTAVLRAPLPVGVSRTLWMGLGPWPLDEDGAEEERVVLELRANAPGALRIEKAWKDLPRAR